MDYIYNVISALIGGLIAAGLTYWRMKVSKSTRRDDLHNAALAQIDIWEAELDQFFTRYNLTEPTHDFRLMFLDLADTRSEVTRIKSRTCTMSRLARNIRGKYFSSGFKEILEAVEELDELWAGTRFDDKEIADCVDKLRESFELVKDTLSDVKRI